MKKLAHRRLGGDMTERLVKESSTFLLDTVSHPSQTMLWMFEPHPHQCKVMFTCINKNYFYVNYSVCVLKDVHIFCKVTLWFNSVVLRVFKDTSQMGLHVLAN